MVKIKDKGLSQKEKLFCAYYRVKHNALEAAVKAGYTVSPERAAVRLMKKEAVKAYLAEISAENAGNREEIVAGLRRLAFGCISDSIKLAFSENIDCDGLEKLDLFGISEIKVNRGKGVEIKFFDRIKALERLSEIIGSEKESSASGFFDAIEKGARALGKAREEDD